MIAARCTVRATKPAGAMLRMPFPTLRLRRGMLAENSPWALAVGHGAMREYVFRHSGILPNSLFEWPLFLPSWSKLTEYFVSEAVLSFL